MKHLFGFYCRRFYLWWHRKKDKYWWVGLHCNACGKNVFKHAGDYFMLKPEVWKQATNTPYTSTKWVLCKKCTERLLGRKLQPEDFVGN